MYEFKPFDRVLVRDDFDEDWDIDLFGYIKDGKYCCLAGYHTFCIPFEGNERLLGTTDAPEPAWMPQRGELVAVRDYKDKPWVARVFENYNLDAQFRKWLCVAEPDTDCDIIAAWEYCEPLKKHFTVGD